MVHITYTIQDGDRPYSATLVGADGVVTRISAATRELVEGALRGTADIDMPPAVLEALAELTNARLNWPSYNSAHEGWAILAEEFDELWDEVKVNQKRRDLAKMRHEAIQVAAVAMRFADDVCNEIVGRK